MAACVVRAGREGDLSDGRHGVADYLQMGPAWEQPRWRLFSEGRGFGQSNKHLPPSLKAISLVTRASEENENLGKRRLVVLCGASAERG